MKSKDFIELTNKIHNEKYNVLSTHIEIGNIEDDSKVEARVVLEKDSNQITLESSEMDFFFYIIKLRGVADMTGDYKFARLRNLSQYNVDAEYLIDKDRSKIKKADDDIRSGKFTFTYNPPKLINEFLKNERNVKDKKFLPLKSDYHYILANNLLVSEEMLKAHKRIALKYHEAKKTIKALDTILKSFMYTGNAIKNYKLYRKYLNFDIGELGQRMSTQLIEADDINKEFIRRGKIDANIALPRTMNTYANFLEILKPMLNLLRIGLELRRGNNSPSKHRELGENIEILKSDTEFGSLFGCLDEQIRHASAHASFLINKAVRKVYLKDERGSKGKIVRGYTFDELTDMINIMQNEFFPVIYPTLILFDIAVLDLLLVSTEYKFLLLAIGNC